MLRARLPFVLALLVAISAISALPMAFVACEAPARPPAATASRRAALGPCGLTVSRLNVDQIGADDGSREFIELSAPDGVGQTLGACGLTAVGSYEGSGTPGEPCAPEPPSRWITVAERIVPADGFVILARGGDTSLGTVPDATTTAKTGPWLENGPDYLVLQGPSGPLAALQIGATPTCTLPEGTSVEPVPKDDDVAAAMDKQPDEHLFVRCPEGYRSVSWSTSPPRSPVDCPPLEGPPAASATSTSTPISPPSASATASTTLPPLPPEEIPTENLVPPCRVRFDKVDIAQPPSGASSARDTREAVELAVTGEIPPGATLATCGVVSFAPFRTGSKTQVSLCSDAATSYGEVAIGHIPVPKPPYVLLAQRGDADSPLSVAKTSGLLSNGPDYLALRDARGLIVDAVAYPAGAAPAYYPACPGWEKAVAIPACEDAAKKGVENQIAVRCPDGSWRAVPESQVSFHQAALCGVPSPAKNTTGEASGEGSPDDEAPEGDAREPLPAASGSSGPTATPPQSQRLPLRDATCQVGPLGAGRAAELEAIRASVGFVMLLVYRGRRHAGRGRGGERRR